MGVSWWVLDIGGALVEPLVGRRDVCGLPPYGMRRDNIYHFCVAEEPTQHTKLPYAAQIS